MFFSTKIFKFQRLMRRLSSL